MKRVVKDPETRRKEIVLAAKEIFESSEYEAVTMQTIMDRLGIAKGTIYHYFKSKDALLEAVVQLIVDQHIERMITLVEGIKGNAIERLKAVVEHSKEVTTQNLIDSLHRRGNEAMHNRLLVESMLIQAKLFSKLIKQGCDEGLFLCKKPLEVAEFILSGMQFLTDEGIHPWSKKDIVRRMKAFPGIVEKLLQAQEGSLSFLGIGN